MPEPLLDLIYGPADRGEAARTPPERWLRRPERRRAAERRCGRLLVGWLVRAGGCLPEAHFDPSGAPLGEGPIWAEPATGLADWRLSGTSWGLLLWLWQQLASDRGAALPSPAWQPATAVDLVFAHALLERLEAVPALASQSACAHLAARSPLTALLRPERPTIVDVSGPALAPWLAADWLIPSCQPLLVRRWLAVDQQRETLLPAAEQQLNVRLEQCCRRLVGTWESTGRSQHLTLLVSFFARWLRLRGGAGGVLTCVRRPGLAGLSTAAREELEHSLGRVFEQAVALVEIAADRRRLGWQRTAADEAFLGCFARELEPWAETVTLLQAELSRLV